MSDTAVLSAQEQFDLDSESPIYCDLLAEMFDDMMAAAQLATECNPWDFGGYFDADSLAQWDEWTILETDTTLNMEWPYVLLVETQALPIVGLSVVVSESEDQ
jgi:hypothetical protein